MTPVELKALIFMIKQGSYIEANNLWAGTEVLRQELAKDDTDNWTKVHDLLEALADYRKYTKREAEAAMYELFDEVRKIEKP